MEKTAFTCVFSYIVVRSSRSVFDATDSMSSSLLQAAKSSLADRIQTQSNYAWVKPYGSILCLSCRILIHRTSSTTAYVEDVWVQSGGEARDQALTCICHWLQFLVGITLLSLSCCNSSYCHTAPALHLSMLATLTYVKREITPPKFALAAL